MCLGIPGEILDVRQENGLRVAKVQFAGIRRDVCLDYVPDAKPGEFVLVHVGFAISRIDADEAARAYRILEELGQTSELTADLAAASTAPNGRGIETPASTLDSAVERGGAADTAAQTVERPGS